MTLEGIRSASSENSKSVIRDNSNQTQISTRTKICLFLSSNPLIASGLLIALGVSLPFNWPVTLLLGGVFSLVFLSLAAVSANLEMENSAKKV